MAVILMTGASGAIGGMLRQRPAQHELRLTDVRADDGVEALDVTDAAAVERASRGVDAVVHLGGIADEGPFEDVLAVNVRGTERVLQAAHRTGVPRVLLASSNHAAGLYERSDAGPEGLPARTRTTAGARRRWKRWAGCITIGTASTSSACALVPAPTGPPIRATCR